MLSIQPQIRLMIIYWVSKREFNLSVALSNVTILVFLQPYNPAIHATIMFSLAQHFWVEKTKHERHYYEQYFKHNLPFPQFSFPK